MAEVSWRWWLRERKTREEAVAVSEIKTVVEEGQKLRRQGLKYAHGSGGPNGRVERSSVLGVREDTGVCGQWCLSASSEAGSGWVSSGGWRWRPS
jgi:hypothetical protein